MHSKYWCDVLKTWLDKNSNSLEVASCSVEDQNLWNNDDIKFKQNVLFFKEWINAGIYKLGHMFNDEGYLRSVNDIITIVGNSAARQFQYNAVFNVIPAEWRVRSGINQAVEPTLFWDKNLLLLSTKDIRRQLTGLNYSQPCSVGFWSSKFSFDLDFRTWIISYSCTKETRLLVLHWKLLHNIYPTNIMLKKMNMCNSEMCSFGCGEKDYIEHFFFSCRVAKKLWCHVENVLHGVLERTVCIDITNVMFAFQTHPDLAKEERIFINLSLLIGKMCISKYKYGTQVNIALMFDRELSFRRKQFPVFFHRQGCFMEY